MEIELKLNPDINELLPEIKKETQKKEIEISDFIMIIEDLINQGLTETNKNIKNTKLENENQIEIDQNEEIFSEFELQVIEAEQINKKTEKNNITTLFETEKIESEEKHSNKESTTKDIEIKYIEKIEKIDINQITQTEKEEIYTKNKFNDTNDLLNETTKIKNKEENLKIYTSKDLETQQEKNKLNIKNKDDEKILKEDFRKPTINNEERTQQVKTNNQLQDKSIFLNQKNLKDIEINIFKKEERNQIKDEITMFNTKVEEKELKYEKNQEPNIKTNSKELPEQRIEKKRFEINDDRIGKIKMTLNTTSKEMDIKITTNDKEIFKHINETKNQLSNEITKNTELEKANIKINLNDENQNSKKQNQDNNKKNKKLNKQKKEGFEVV